MSLQTSPVNNPETTSLTTQATSLSLGLSFLGLVLLRAYAFLGDEFFSPVAFNLSLAAMALMPWVFLSKPARATIGVYRAPGWVGAAVSAGIGVAGAALCYGLGLALFGKSDLHWFSSFAYRYQSYPIVAQLDQNMAFLMVTGPAVLAISFGEELYFRGYVESKAHEHGRSLRSAALFSAFLFAGMQLFSHGIVRTHLAIEVLWSSAIVWFGLMLSLGLVFSYLRHRFQSSWAPVIGHAFFYLTMNYAIFYSLMVQEAQTLSP